MFTHKELCFIAEKWLRKSCPIRCYVTFVEPVTLSYEIPDAIGFNSKYSVLVEVKTSKADFLRDKKKLHRQHPEMGVGDFRYYLCPKGILNPEDIPDKWGLVWVNELGKTRVVKSILKGSGVAYKSENRFIEKNNFNERCIMYSALRRLEFNK